MSLRNRFLLPIGRLVLAIGMIFAGAAMSSCSQSTRSEDVLLPGETPGSKNDPYPDFSKPLTSAMKQMSDEDAKKMSAQLAALASQRQSGAISEAEYWRRVNEMRKLGATMPQSQAE